MIPIQEPNTTVLDSGEEPALKRVLLVEDDPADRYLIETLLLEHGIDLVCSERVANGFAALAQGWAPDAILLDLSLPDSQGLDTVTKVRQRAPDIPIVVLTGTDDSNLGLKAIQLGAQDYLAKGRIDRDLLLRSLHYACERQRISRDLAQAVAAKSRFLSMVSHELRTPLTALKEGVGLVYNGTAGDLNSEQRELLEIAVRNLKRLARLIDNVLDLQRLDAGLMSLDLQAQDLNAVMSETKTMMEPLTEERGLFLELDADYGLPLIQFDRDRIVQVVTNLVHNAVKFTERGGIILRTRQGNNLVQVSVEDTGPGIREEDLPRLFHEFEQLESQGPRQTGGSGLGLAIAREIVKSHRGKIWAESRVGQGTIVHFILPISERRGQGREHGSKEDSPSR